jgi:hypothetical protein
MYTLKPPFQTNCFQCKKKLTVNFCPPSQKYSNKNNWGYWTEQNQNQGQYRCDTCLIDLYRHHKIVYLDSITDSKKRKTFRAYFGGKVSSPLTKTQQEQLEKDEFRTLLEKKGFDLNEDGLGDYLENWRQTMLKLVEENSRQEKRIKELEKKLAKKPSAKSRN